MEGPKGPLVELSTGVQRGRVLAFLINSSLALAVFCHQNALVELVFNYFMTHVAAITMIKLLV